VCRIESVFYSFTGLLIGGCGSVMLGSSVASARGVVNKVRKPHILVCSSNFRVRDQHCRARVL
jgi:hypothetical protein